MRIYLGILTGFDTNAADPTNPDCGMRMLAESLKANQFAGHDVSIAAHGYDETNPDGVCRSMKDDITLYQADLVILLAHSFGNNVLAFFSNWLQRWFARTLDGAILRIVGVCFDPVENPIFDLETWSLETTVEEAIGFFQKAGRPLGISGEPFDPRPDGSIRMIDVTNWVNPTLAHISVFGWTGIIVDSRVQTQVKAYLAAILAKRLAEETA